MTAIYPEPAQDRDAWILARRGSKNSVDPMRPYAFHLEEELSAERELVPVATVFLTNRECPWRCVMCDLWKNTLNEVGPAGAVASQIEFALSRLGPARHIKLYNSGSFFDRGAIPADEHEAIVGRIHSFERVIVECHPALIGERVLGFRDMLRGQLEVAMGLETAHPETLERLNKRMTLDQFAAAAQFLREHDVAMRAFVLIKPPFQNDDEVRTWATRSIEFAFDCGATAVSLIPTRFGNGALETLAEQGLFTPPTLELIETVVDDGLALKRGRLFVDLWDLEKFSRCSNCFAPRMQRLRRMNLQQVTEVRTHCALCAGTAVLSP